MSDNRWWRHRKKRHRRDPLFNDIFDEFDRIEHMMDEMMRQAFERPTSTRRTRRPYVYGFSMTTGPDGKPIIKQFGNIKPDYQHSKPLIKEIREETEPLVDVLEEDKTITVVAQLQGIKQQDIDVYVTETQVTISVNAKEHTYYKKLQLPAIVDPRSVKKSYKNGVLQIKLQKMPLAKTPYEEHI